MFIENILQENILFATKITILVFIFLYLIFIFMAFIQVRSLKKLVTIHQGAESAVIQNIFFIYLLVVAVLFIVALVIL